jgi:hypothetical protein
MVVLLQLILCLLSSVCFGMEIEQQKKYEVLNMHHLNAGICNIYQGKINPVQGILQIHYTKKDAESQDSNIEQNEKYEICAVFIPKDESKVQIKLEKFTIYQKDVEEKYDLKCKRYPSYFFLLRQNQEDDPEIALEITKIEKFNEPQKSLDMSQARWYANKCVMAAIIIFIGYQLKNMMYDWYVNYNKLNC